MQVYTPKEAAKVLGIGLRTFWEWVAAGRIACSRMGRIVRLTEQDIADCLSRHRKPRKEHLAVTEQRRGETP